MRFIMSAWLFICLSMWNNSAPTGRIFIKRECIKFNVNLSKTCQKNSSFITV